MCIHKYQKCQERGCYQLHAVFYKCYISNRTRQKQSYPVFLNCLYVRLYKNCNGTIETIIQLSLFVILLLHLYYDMACRTHLIPHARYCAPYLHRSTGVPRDRVDGLRILHATRIYSSRFFWLFI